MSFRAAARNLALVLPRKKKPRRDPSLALGMTGPRSAATSDVTCSAFCLMLSAYCLPITMFLGVCFTYSRLPRFAVEPDDRARGHCGRRRNWCRYGIIGFLRMFRELPNIDAILLNPTKEPVPENAAAQYAVASALARCATDTNFDRICLYLNRLPTEFRVLCFRDATLREPAIRCTAGYTTWGEPPRDRVVRNCRSAGA